jgi:hypothetical protein
LSNKWSPFEMFFQADIELKTCCYQTWSLAGNLTF